ncbi:hypothetical protein CkaCkLH20_05565 [Colletotrichum karsti]|uniref:Uncharacterized protein n=1 Tax=Colletotrichum karsti TaxID=1095194 RepID=A0A9P6LHW5_9PEZI|nr:uncharacterized protein CkaCkLH20_05565 [Colletotrichum karsti]KAF9876719.1 hypothetical protein CkaCkLH20_05565 [Colletotrichum karsti]
MLNETHLKASARLPASFWVIFANISIDFPAEAYTGGADSKNAGGTPFAKRPSFNTYGGLCNLEVNQFRVKSWNDKMSIY